MLFSPPGPPQTFLQSDPLNIIVSLYKKKKKTCKNLNKQSNKSKKKTAPQASQIKQKVHKTNIGFVLCWSTIPWKWGLPWNVVGIACSTWLEKTDFPFLIRYEWH